VSRVVAPFPIVVPLSRRELVRRLAVVVAGVGAAACAPLRIALKAYPEQFGTDAGSSAPSAPSSPSFRRRLRPAHLFADTFIRSTTPRLLRGRLCRRAGGVSESRFDRLPPDARTWVVRRGLRQRGVIGRMYAGAVLLAQIAVYGGIHDDSRGCPLIGFDGGGRVPTPVELTYPDAERFLARSLTTTGNLS
jgi:hypothetical protein